MTLSLYSILAIAALIQSLFLSGFLFFNKRGNPLNNRLFGLFLFVLALSTLFSFSRSTLIGETLIADQYIFIYIAAEINYLFGPLFLLLAKSNLDRDYKFARRDIMHLLPFVIMTLIASIHIVYFYFSGVFVFTEFRLVDCSIMILHITVYDIAAYLYLIKMKGNNSTDKVKLKWLFTMFAGFSVLMFAKILTLISVSWWISYYLFVYSHAFYFVLLFIFFYWVSFYLLKKPEIIFFSKKYLKSELKEEDIIELKQRLVNYIEKSKIYLQPDITVVSLAKNMSLPVPYLSRVINESFNINFNDFINRYRVEESKILLKEQNKNKKTILDISYSSGFNSRSSFYEAFKKQTGMTPTEYSRSENTVTE